MSRLLVFSLALFLIACADDKSNNSPECVWYEIGGWQFAGETVDRKSTFNNCGTSNGVTLIRIDSVDGEKREYLHVNLGEQLPPY